MSARWAAAAAVVLFCAVTPAFGHRLDEYLQATTLSLAKDRVRGEMRLTPGVAVFPMVIAAIDTDRDGKFSTAEQKAYALHVLGDLALTVDSHRLPLRLVSWNYPAVKAMQGGLGEIELAFDAAIPAGGHDRKLVFENHHQPRIAAYLVNCLVPGDPDIRITGQNRNYLQSRYRLDYVQASPESSAPPRFGAGRFSSWGKTGAVVMLLASTLELLRRARRGAPARRKTRFG